MLIVAVVLGLILFFGGKVNEKVQHGKQLLVILRLSHLRYMYTVLCIYTIYFGCEISFVSQGFVKLVRVCLRCLECQLRYIVK